MGRYDKRLKFPGRQSFTRGNHINLPLGQLSLPHFTRSFTHQHQPEDSKGLRRARTTHVRSDASDPIHFNLYLKIGCPVSPLVNARARSAAPCFSATCVSAPAAAPNWRVKPAITVPLDARSPSIVFAPVFTSPGLQVVCRDYSASRSNAFPPMKMGEI